MAKNLPGSIPSNTLGVLGDIFQKVAAGVFSHLELERFVQKLNPFEIKMDKDSQLASWCALLKDLCGIEIDSGQVPIPKPTDGFNRLIVVPQGLTFNQIIEVCRTRFGNVYSDYRNLDEQVTVNDRTNQKTYAIWVRNRVEADEEFKNLSADDLATKQIHGTTLLERLLYEFKYHSETGDHLDIENVTSCTGSRGSGGFVPCVFWNRDLRGLFVFSYHPGCRRAGLRVRQVVA